MSNQCHSSSQGSQPQFFPYIPFLRMLLCFQRGRGLTLSLHFLLQETSPLSVPISTVAFKSKNKNLNARKLEVQKYKGCLFGLVFLGNNVQ